MNVQNMPSSLMEAANFRMSFMPEAEADRLIDLYCCLMKITDPSELKKVRDALVNRDFSQDLSESDCSALAFCLLTAEEVQDVLNASVISTNQEGKQRLISAVQNIKTAVFRQCSVSDLQMRVISSALSSCSSNIQDLDLGENDLSSSGLDFLCDGLKSANCKLESLTLQGCGLTPSFGTSLASALKFNSPHLAKLYAKDNPDLCDSGLKPLCDYLKQADCGLEILDLENCGLTVLGCFYLASALNDNMEKSALTKLCLDNNGLSDEDVQPLVELQKNPESRLKDLTW